MSSPLRKSQPEEKELFLRALEIEAAEERRAFLSKECGENTDLQSRLKHLLQIDETSDDSLLDPARYGSLTEERKRLAEELRLEKGFLQRLGDRIE